MSLHDVYTIVNLGSEIEEQITVNREDYQPGKYACIYDRGEGVEHYLYL